MNTKNVVTIGAVLLIVVEVTLGIERPSYCVDIATANADADLVCGGLVVSVENKGKEGIAVAKTNGRTTIIDTEVLLARIAVKCIFKGQPTNEVALQCHRNLAFGMPGITEGACLLFIRKNAEVFEPVRELAYAIPVTSTALDMGTTNMQEILKTTIANRKRDTIRICLDVLQQLMPDRDFVDYVRQLTTGEDKYIQGVALLFLVEKGDNRDILRAETFTETNYDDTGLVYVSKSLSYELERVKNKGRSNANRQ